METHIGDLVLTSELTSSNWGDKHLYFRHQVEETCCPGLRTPEIGSLLNTLFMSGHGGGRGAGAGLGAVPRQVRAGARVRVSGGRGAGPGAGQEGRPSLDYSLFIVQFYNLCHVQK